MAVTGAVADGDTVDVVFGNPPEGCGKKERVRLIGVNTPELTKDPPEYYAGEARDFTNRWWRANVRIVFDRVSSRRDVYGRLLASMHLEDGTPLNELLIREGYGRYYGNFAFEAERFRQEGRSCPPLTKAAEPSKKKPEAGGHYEPMPPCANVRAW